MTNPHYNSMVEYLDAMVSKNEPLLTALVYGGAAELNLTAHPFATEAPFFRITYTVLFERPNAYCVVATTDGYADLAFSWSFYGGNPLPEEFVDTGWLWSRFREERKNITEFAAFYEHAKKHFEKYGWNPG